MKINDVFKKMNEEKPSNLKFVFEEFSNIDNFIKI